MGKKLVHDVALIATKLHEAGLTFEDAELAAQYCLLENLGAPYWFIVHPSKKPADILWQGFSWSFTPEGHEYWYERANLLV